MRLSALLLVFLGALCGRAGDSVVVLLPTKATSDSSTVTLGKVAKLYGGEEKARKKLAALDLAERTRKDSAVTITRRHVELRLRLAGYGEDAVLVGGAEAVVVAFEKKVASMDDAITEARKSLLASFPNATDLTATVVIRPQATMPEIDEKDRVSFSAQPHGTSVKPGRNQMDVTLKVNGETKLAFPIHFDVKSAQSSAAVVSLRRPVKLLVRSGGLTIEADGEALADGRVGETIPVRNMNTKKMLQGKVVATDRVEIALGGAP